MGPEVYRKVHLSQEELAIIRCQDKGFCEKAVSGSRKRVPFQHFFSGIGWFNGAGRQSPGSPRTAMCRRIGHSRGSQSARIHYFSRKWCLLVLISAESVRKQLSAPCFLQLYTVTGELFFRNPVDPSSIIRQEPGRPCHP